MPAKPKVPAKPVARFEIPILFNEPLEMPSVYATNMTVHVTDHEVVLTFYEAQPPLNSNSPEELQKSGVRADCVARVTVARARFAGFAHVIQETVKQAKELTPETK